MRALLVLLTFILAAGPGEAQSRRVRTGRRAVGKPSLQRMPQSLSESLSPVTPQVATSQLSSPPAPPSLTHEFYFGLGFISYSERRQLNREQGASVSANMMTLGRALKLEYAARKSRTGFRTEAFYHVNRATIQSADPNVDYLSAGEEHTGMGVSFGPYYHFTTVGTTAGVSIPLLYRALNIRNAATLSSVEGGVLVTYGALLDLRWRLSERFYLEQKFGVVSDFRGPFWQIALDFRLK